MSTDFQNTKHYTENILKNHSKKRFPKKLHLFAKQCVAIHYFMPKFKKNIKLF